METKPILINDGNTWKVLSSNGKDYYTVYKSKGDLVCNCFGFQYRGTCRHVKIVQPLMKEENIDILSKLKQLQSGKIPVSEIDNYLTDQEFDKAIADGLILVNNGKVFIL